MRSPQPRRSKISSVRLAKQIAREPVGEPVVIVKEQDRDALLCKVDCGREANRAGSHHHDPMMRGFVPILIRGTRIIESYRLIVGAAAHSVAPSRPPFFGSHRAPQPRTDCQESRLRSGPAHATHYVAPFALRNTSEARLSRSISGHGSSFAMERGAGAAQAGPG